MLHVAARTTINNYRTPYANKQNSKRLTFPAPPWHCPRRQEIAPFLFPGQTRPGCRRRVKNREGTHWTGRSARPRRRGFGRGRGHWARGAPGRVATAASAHGRLGTWLGDETPKRTLDRTVEARRSPGRRAAARQRGGRHQQILAAGRAHRTGEEVAGGSAQLSRASRSRAVCLCPRSGDLP